MMAKVNTTTNPTATVKKKSYSPTRELLKKFLRQKMAVIAGVVVLGIIIIGIIAPWVVPYDPNRPVTAQYAEKGIVVTESNTAEVKFTVLDSEHREVTEFGTARVEAVNRRVTSARVMANTVRVNAINPGQTHVVLTVGDVSSAFRVNVLPSRGAEIVSKLLATRPGQPLQVGGTYSIKVLGVLSNGETVDDLEQVVSMVKEMREGVQDYSGGWGVAAQEVKLTFKSLTPNVVKVYSDGQVQAVGTGTGKVKVGIGDLSTVVPVPVGVAQAEPFIAEISFDNDAVRLADIYKHQLPSGRHWFGTDHQNRDIFSRVLVGTRETLIIGFVSVFIGALIGTLLGLLAGYYGGWIDGLLTRFTDVLLAFPGILLAIAVIALLGPGVTNIIFAVAFFTVPIFLRIVRGSALELKNMTYVEAARSIGVRDFTIILRHIFPGTLSIVMVYLTMRIGTAILIGASLSFLGLGGDITAPEWGAMLSAAKDNSRNIFHPTFFPGLAIVITVLAFNILGDGLRDALDPKITD